jgi:hypothetical protein
VFNRQHQKQKKQKKASKHGDNSSSTIFLLNLFLTTWWAWLWRITSPEGKGEHFHDNTGNFIVTQ